MNNKQLINKYQNGPVTVSIYTDGTKIREWDENKYSLCPELDFAESIDCKITNQCDMKCPFCHEASTDNGKHGDIKKFMQLIDNADLPKGVELAVGGGNPMDHPEIWQFLRFCFNRGIIVNMTMNINHLMRANYFGMVMRSLDQDLIKGLGISVTDKQLILSDVLETINKFYKKSDNVVLHIIEGINDYGTVVSSVKELNRLYSIKPKILILGKKDFGRFTTIEDHFKRLYNQRSITWYDNIIDFIKYVTNLEGVVSLDNLAIDNFDLLERLPKDVIAANYMGKDGTHTFYCDVVNWEYAAQSTTPKESLMPMNNKSLREMYKDVYRNS
jgi:organic radical activating enzyme